MLRKLFGPVTPVGLERTSTVPLQPLELTHTELSTPHTKPKNIARWAHVPMNSQCLGLRGLPHPKDVNTEHFSPSQPVAIRSAPAAVPRTAALVAQCASNDPHKYTQHAARCLSWQHLLEKFPQVLDYLLIDGMAEILHSAHINFKAGSAQLRSSRRCHVWCHHIIVRPP